MKIALLSKSDSSGGGASRVAQELQEQLSLKHKVVHFTKDNCTFPRVPLYGNYAKKIYSTLREVGFQEFLPFELFNIYKEHKKEQFDLFHFHDLSTAISPLTLKILSKNHRVIMTIHDASLVTGGCIYTLGCSNYKRTCHSCPQKREWPFGKRVDMSSFFHALKKYLLKNSTIEFIAPSKWMADFVYETGLLHSYPTIIPNGVDTDKFILYNKQEIRTKLNLPQDKFIILLSSSSLNSPFKGIKYAIEIIQKLKVLNPFILLVGKENDTTAHLLKSFDTFTTGYISDTKLLNQFYSSADIFLNTTIADNLPLTVLEVMASGTPNIGFKTGGISEIVSHNIDGFLQNDVEILIEFIKESTHKNQWFKMGKLARQKIESHFSLALFISRHLELYLKTPNTHLQ